MRLASLMLALPLIGCGKQTRVTPDRPEVRAMSAAEVRGERLFGKFCYQCHPDGAGGLGPALNNKPLPALAVRTQIRQGIGAMPSFGDDWLTDEQVAAIAEYVTALRDTP